MEKNTPDLVSTQRWIVNIQGVLLKRLIFNVFLQAVAGHLELRSIPRIQQQHSSMGENLPHHIRSNPPTPQLPWKEMQS